MPKIHTIEDNFDYQVKQIVNELKQKLDGDKEEGETWGDVFWRNKDEVGEVFFNTVEQHFGSEIFDKE
jgi:hypothetical protein